MSFIVQASPGVKYREIDLTTVVQAAAATDGAFAGRFNWGPVLEPVLVSDEPGMVNRFGQPVSLVESQDFLTAASFLAYTNQLRVVRIGNTDNMMAAGDTQPEQVWNDDSYETFIESAPTANTFIARYPGEVGNTIAIHAIVSQDQYQKELTPTSGFSVEKGSKEITVDSLELTLTDEFRVGSVVNISSSKYTVVAVEDDNGSGTGTLTLERAYAGTTEPSLTSLIREWEFASQFGGAPGAGEAHVVVQDVDGTFSGVEGTILESYGFLSTDSPQAKYEDGTARYYTTAINRQSQFIRWGGADLGTTAAGTTAVVFELAGGVDDNDNAGTGEYIDGYGVFSNAEEVDASLIIVPGVNSTVANFVIDNVAEVRKDTVAFIGPEMSDVVNNRGNEVNDVLAFRNSLTSTTYALMGDNWKYMYDKYNDAYRWVPITGDLAGLTARTEANRAAWFSPAGFNRGVIKNVVKLAWSADEPRRNVLYPSGINSVVNFNGIGKVLYGDKTLSANQTSAFSRINVRRLFIILEKAIANAAQFSLFEFNDEFTRSAFVSIVEPFLREVQGGRGIIDFEVVCDERNNTPQVINTNNFVGDIYIKPNRSINFITLNFVAVGTGVSFDEVIGRAA